MKLHQLISVPFILVLAGCSLINRATPTIPAPFDGGEIQVPVAAQKARSSLSEMLDVPVDQITIKEIQEMEWSDSCLDVGQVGELCVQQITPGYLVVLTYQEQKFSYHTDLIGSQVRSIPDAALASEAALQSKQLLAGLLGYNPESVRILKEESVRFSDSCLEISTPETICSQVQIQGKQISLEAGGIAYEFRSPDEPVRPVLAAAGGIKAGKVVLMLSRLGGPDNYCDNVNLTLGGQVIQYTCRNVPGEVPGISDLSAVDQSRLLRWVLAYSPYDVTQTRQDGVKIRITFNGIGPAQAQFGDQETIRVFSEGLIRMPKPFPSPLPTAGPED